MSEGVHSGRGIPVHCTLYIVWECQGKLYFGFIRI